MQARYFHEVCQGDQDAVGIAVILGIIDAVLILCIIIVVLHHRFASRDSQRQAQNDIELGERNPSPENLDSGHSVRVGNTSTQAQHPPATNQNAVTNLSEDFVEVPLGLPTRTIIRTADAVPIRQVQRAEAPADVQPTPSSPSGQVQNSEFYTLRTVELKSPKKSHADDASEDQQGAYGYAI
ncbi:hypothetical protein F5Y12DRAFT_797380 [Xylaria sp. FL1777]|nr:hypothetical protein F5Y12DRAFT_797380 [Xylaria sp. FL1777]